MKAEITGNSHRHAALFVCSLLTGIGWMILVAAALLVLPTVYETLVSQQQPTQVGYRFMMLGQLAGMMFLGVIAVMLAQFIKYAFGALDEAPFLVRHCQKILFLCAATAALSGVANIVYSLGSPAFTTLPVALAAFATVAKTLTLCGMGLALAKGVAAIHEVRGVV